MAANAMPLQVGGNGSAELYAGARGQISTGKRFEVKPLEEVKHGSGTRVQLYPRVTFNTPASELAYALMVNKQAIEHAHTIPFPKGFALVSNRMGKDVQDGAKL